MTICCVFGCTNRSDRNKKQKAAKVAVSFFRLPKVVTHIDEETNNYSVERRKRWINAIKREDLDSGGTHYRVCSDHFISGMDGTHRIFCI